MSAGSIKLQASDTKVATVTFEDGAAGNVSVVVPKEGGTLASEAYVTSQIGAIPVIGDASVTTKGIIELATNAEVQTGTDTTRAVTPAGMKAGLNASGTAPIYACRAWVNFNGTGTVAIRASGNVSSITDNGVGSYTVNFTTAMPDVNYAPICTASNSGSSAVAEEDQISPIKTTTQVRLISFNTTNGSSVDVSNYNASIFR